MVGFHLKSESGSSLSHHLDWNLQSCELWEWPVSITMPRAIEKTVLQRQTKVDCAEIQYIMQREEEIRQMAVAFLGPILP